VKNSYKIWYKIVQGKDRTLEYNIKNDVVVNWKIVDWVPLTEGQGRELE